MSDHKLTTAAGAPVVDNMNIETAGRRGPALLQDVWLIEKLAHFAREVIPERRMHAKGAGAHGTFTVTSDITRFTKASIFAGIGKVTPMFARFSTVAGERGAADAERDIRGFALKFYTDQGNWDLVGNNTPVFFFRDPLRFPDLNHVVKRDPHTGLRNAESKFDFFTQVPESLHQVTIELSERGIPKSYRHMHGFGSHTYSFINAANERCWVKFTLKTQQGIETLSDAEAALLIGQDRESHHRDLFGNIEKGNFPRWVMYVQIMSERQAVDHPHNPFDLTKVWPHADYPLIEVGVMELSRNPENVFAEVEQASFAPSSVVPGISFSPDKMLQARLFSYGDAARYRLGVNHSQIPVTDHQRVHAGQVVIRLDARDYQAALDHAGAVVDGKHAVLDSLRAQLALQQSIIQQQAADLEAKGAQADYAAADAERYRSLATTAAGSRQDAQRTTSLNQQAHAAVLAAAAGLQAARQKMPVLAAQIAEAQAAVAQAASDLQTARLDLGYTEIRSPIDGYIGNRAAQVGAYVAQAGYLLSVIPSDGLWVDANFKEDQLAALVSGRSASIVADVLPGHIFHGQVVSLSPGTGAVFSVIPPENATGNFTKIVQRVPVRVAIDPGDNEAVLLRPGLSTVVRVDTRPPPAQAGQAP